jgi:hydrogenase maturation protease
MDLAYALLDGYDAGILVDVTQRGGAPGTLYVLEPEPDPRGTPVLALDPHGMDPARVFEMVRALGGTLQGVRLVGCEPATFGSEDAPVMGLSAPVAAAVAPAVALIESLVREIRRAGVARDA